jgi:large subunit ribosomal protein L1
MADTKKTEEKKVAKKPTSRKVEAAEEKKTKKTTKVADVAIAEEKPSKVTTTKAGLPDEALAKAGKRSKKAQEEAAEAEAKASRKAAKSDEALAKAESEKPKVVQKPRVKKYTKNQKLVRELIEPDKLYTLAEAVELLPKISKVKFDATAELHVACNIDPKQADQQVRSSVALPAGTGKAVRVAVLADEKDASAAKKAGADITNSEDLLAALGKDKFDFDVLVATPAMMAELGRYAKVLGPKGLMPSPKNNTVTADPAAAVEEIKKGQAELRADANGIVHVGFGKLSFNSADLLSNLKAVVAGLNQAKPSGVKGVFVRSMYVGATMSPSIKLDINAVQKEAKE